MTLIVHASVRPQIKVEAKSLQAQRAPLAFRSLPHAQRGGLSQMFGINSISSSLVEIKRTYPDQWVAIAVRKTDADGLPSAGEVLVHDPNEEMVWLALKLGEDDDLIYVFYTGSRKITAAA